MADLEADLADSAAVDREVVEGRADLEKEHRALQRCGERNA